MTSPEPDVMSRCWKCSEDMDDDNDAHLIEAYEETGQIMCASCWEDHCEKQ